MSLTDYRTAVVTGASSGIGEGLVRALRAHDIEVTAVARRADALAALAEETGCRPLPLDLRDSKALHAALAPLQADILVNNAGVGRGMEGMLETAPDDIDEITEINLTAVLHCFRALVPGMVERGRGHVVNIGSVAGLYPLRAPLYGATKGGVHLLSQNMRVELVGTGVRVTEICPGRVLTPFFETNWRDPDKARSFFEGHELLEIKDIVDAAFYALDTPAHVNVATIEIMPVEQAVGGLTIRRRDEARA
jgi:NADP-dependent 3-hydroxy acid dehydrogenase YdfG